jgi:hypothetical protein
MPRPLRFVTPRLRVAAGFVAGIVLSAQAIAAADDELAPTSPVGAPGGFAAAARKLIDDTVETERAVVTALRENVFGSWRLNLGTPYGGRGTAFVAHASAAGDDDASAASSEGLDLSLGARWRVLHGDASSHVPTAAWMPDLQSADARTAALRPKMSLSGEWALPNDFSLGVMPGMAVDYSVDGRRQATGTFAVTLGKSWSAQWRTFVDMARDRVAAVQLSGVSTSVDAGISFIAAPGTQIDFAVTRGLSDTAPVFQAGLGLSSSF